MKKRKDISSLHYEIVAQTPTRTETRRAEILEAVVQILAHDGVDELTFERVGKTVGMARSHVIYYFKDRNELVTSAIRFAALSAGRIIDEHIEAALRGSSDWKVGIRGYVRGNFTWIGSYPAHANVYTLLYYFASLKPDFRTLHTEIREAGEDRIRKLIEKGPLKGKKKRVHTLAKSIQGLVTGNLIDVMTTDLRPELLERMNQTLVTVDEWLAKEG